MIRYLLLLKQTIQLVQDYLWPPCWSPLWARIEQDVNVQQSAGLSDLQQEERKGLMMYNIVGCSDGNNVPVGGQA